MSILSPSASTTAHQLAAVAAAASAMTSLDQVSSQFMPKCPLCDKTFANTSNLKHHMNTIHFNEAKWICNECGKVCTSKSNLKVHLRVHLRVKPYYCRWCDYNCMHHSSIRDHLSKCHPEKAHNSCEPGYIFNSAAVPEPELSTFESTYGSTFKALEEEAAAAAAAAAVAHANNNCEKQLLSNKIDSGSFQDVDDGIRGDELCRNKQFQAVSSFKFKKKLLKKHQQQFNLKRKFMSYSMSTSASSYPDACGNANNNHDDADNSDDNNLIDGCDDNNNNNGGEMANDDDGNVYMADSYQTYREEDADETYENGGSVGKKLNSSFSNLDVQNLNSYYKNNNTTNNNTESSNNLNKAANLILASNALLQGGSQNNSNRNNNMNLNSLAATFLQQLTNSAAYGIFQQYNLLSASPSSLVANLQSMAAIQQQQQQAQQQQQHNQQASNFAAVSTVKKEPLKFTNSKSSSILSDSASSGTQGSTNKTMEELNSPSSSSSSASSPPPLSPAGSSTYSSSASSSTTSVNQGLVKNGGGLMLLKNATVKLNQKAISEVIKRLNGGKEISTGNEVKKEDESSGGESSSSSSSGVHGDDYDDVGDNENEMNNGTHVTGSDNCGTGTTNGTTDEVDMMMMMRGDANCEGPELVPGDDSSSANSYKCKFCNIIFNEYSLYSIHAGMHADGANPWKCKVCGHVCTNKVDFSVHILHLSKI